MTQRERIEIALSKKGLCTDNLTKNKGVWKFKSFYFYRMGQSAEAIARKIEEALPGVEIISFNDRWNRWPKNSWFEVKFQWEEI